MIVIFALIVLVLVFLLLFSLLTILLIVILIVHQGLEFRVWGLGRLGPSGFRV